VQQNAQAEQQREQQQQQQQQCVEQLAVQLLRYSAAREAEAFMAASWTCNICFDTVRYTFVTYTLMCYDMLHSVIVPHAGVLRLKPSWPAGPATSALTRCVVLWEAVTHLT
jgi:hypothetical protein